MASEISLIITYLLFVTVLASLSAAYVLDMHKAGVMPAVSVIQLGDELNETLYNPVMSTEEVEEVVTNVTEVSEATECGVCINSGYVWRYCDSTSPRGWCQSDDSWCDRLDLLRGCGISTTCAYNSTDCDVWESLQ